MAKRVAVVLSGCGHKDGAEITEAVSTLIALSECGAEFEIFAPNHKMEEAGRIARGKIRDLKELKAKNFSGIAFPGGFGVAMHLCTWAQKGAGCTVDPEAERVITEFYMEEKPIAAICIAPALIAKVLGEEGITVTIGNDPETAAEIAKTGAVHSVCAVDDFITDRDHRIISTPAYMYDEAQPFEVFSGVRKAILELVEMA